MRSTSISRWGGLALGALVTSLGVVSIAHAAGVSPDLKCTTNAACVLGWNRSTGDGVEGKNTGSGYGVVGQARSTNAGVGGFNSSGGPGVYGQSSSGSGLSANSSTGFGAQVYSASSDGFVAQSGNGNGADINGTYIGVIGRAPAGGSTYPLALTDSSGNNLVFVDGNGDIFYHGALGQFMRTGRGDTVTSYSAQTAKPTLEDVGSGQLVGGSATVNLDATFSHSIDLGSAYHVFLTPNGDTRGLYVARKSPTSFVVRETQGGHSTLAFDYRIIATPAVRATSVVAGPNAKSIPQLHIAR